MSKLYIYLCIHAKLDPEKRKTHFTMTTYNKPHDQMIHEST